VADSFDFGAYELNIRVLLDKGVIIFCVFIGKELAHFVCLAVDSRCREAVDPYPYDVDFSNKEAITGKAFTVREFRRLGLRQYSGYALRKYCVQKGISRVKGVIEADNYAPLAVAAPHPHMTITARCRYIKLLCFKRFNETRMEPATPREILAGMKGYKDR